MANYPIKLLKDESGTPFVPLTTVSALYMEENESLDDRLATKLEASNIKAGKDITLDVDGNNITINNASIGVLIDNLNTETAGQGSLDAHQGKVLKELIPEVVNNLTTIDSTKALSAHQGYVLAGRSVPTGGATGQVLMKSADDNYSLTWGDAADPNAIVGDGSVRKIVYLTMDEYNALTTIDPDTEYHIQEVNEDLTYISRDDIQAMISAAIAGEDTGEVYSTTEQKIGVWVDTKPIYRKVINTIAPSEIATWTTVGILSNLDELINIYGSLTGADGRKLTLNSGEPGYEICTTYLSPNIEMKIGADNWANKKVYIIIEYTKTTDSPTAIVSGAQALSYASEMLGGDGNISSGYGLRLYSIATQTSPEGYECYCCCIRDTSTLNNEAWIYVHTDPSRGIAFDSEGYGSYSYIIDTSLINTSVVHLIG